MIRKNFILVLVLLILTAQSLNVCALDNEVPERTKLHKAKHKHKKPKKKQKKEPKRCALPAAFDSIFPVTEYAGPTLGVPDTDPEYPLTKSLWKAYPCLKEAKVKFYGWINPSLNLSSSKKSNVPLGFNIVPNRVELQEFGLRLERNPDTVQRCCVDWGFRLTNIFGIDYRVTIMQGIFSDQLLKYNNLYGNDPIEMNGQVYIPWVAQGMLVTFGRYVSPADIEATFAPETYLFTHSLLGNTDIESLMGISAAIKFNNYCTILLGVHAGGDVSAFAQGAHIPSGLAMIRLVSWDNNDSLWGGVVSFNNRKFKGNHDNLQQFNLTWTHRFSKCLFTATEFYYMYQIDSRQGGTCVFGPIRYGSGGGCGPLIPGYSSEIAGVNYIELKTSDKDFVSFRTGYLGDYSGERLSFATSYLCFSVGLTHRFTELIAIRPEINYQFAFHDTPYDNGTKKEQATFNIDLVLRF